MLCRRNFLRFGILELVPLEHKNVIAVKVVAAVIWSEMPLERVVIILHQSWSIFGSNVNLGVKVDILLFLSSKVIMFENQQERMSAALRELVR